MFENNKVLRDTYSGLIHANLSFIKNQSFCRFLGINEVQILIFIVSSSMVFIGH